MDDEIPFNVGGFQVHSDALRELFAEGLGTFVLTVLGCSGNARYFLSQDIGADLISIPWIWGLAYTIGVYVSGGVSGGHLNPAVTLGLASVGKLSWSKVPHYFFAQYVGAFLGAGTVYGVYSEAITSRIELHSAMTLNMTTKIFIPVAGSGVSTATQFIDQVTCCTIFLLLINAVIDERNLTCSRGLKPLLIGFIGLSSIVFTFGYNAGAAVNPARDLAPRLLIWLIGWGPIVFNFDEVGHFWVPLLGCHIGGMLGSWLYRLLIENHWPDDYNISSMVAHDHHGKYNYNDKYFMNKSLSRVRPV